MEPSEVLQLDHPTKNSEDDGVSKQYALLRDSMSASALGSFFWDAAEKAKLFSPSTYTIASWQHHVYTFLSSVVEGLSLPPGVTTLTVQERLQAAVNEWADEHDFLKEIERVEVTESGQVRKLFDRARTMNSERLPQFAEFFRSEEYPSTLWIELDRAISTYLDGLTFIGQRMGVWKSRRPRRLSEVFSRNRLTKLMVEPIQEMLESFLASIMEFYRIFITMDVWSSNSLKEILQEKNIHLERVPPELFEERMFRLQESVTEVRQNLLRFTPLSKLQIDPTVERSFRDIVQVMISERASGERQ